MRDSELGAIYLSPFPGPCAASRVGFPICRDDMMWIMFGIFLSLFSLLFFYLLFFIGLQKWFLGLLLKPEKDWWGGYGEPSILYISAAANLANHKLILPVDIVSWQSVYIIYIIIRSSKVTEWLAVFAIRRTSSCKTAYYTYRYVLQHEPQHDIIPVSLGEIVQHIFCPHNLENRITKFNCS